MAGENQATDLFGDPVIPPREGRGRPPHVPTAERRNRVLLALVRGLKDRDIASLLGISVPTLKQHYFSELAKRRTAALRMEMRQLERLNAQAEKGNVGAEKELARRLETLRMKDQHQRSAPAPKAAAEKLGKKAEAERAAQMQRGLYEPPAAPGGLPH